MKKLLFLLFPFLVFANQYIFSASWQKGFCKTTYAKECKYTKNYDYFTIHGLWPKKKNCYGIKKFRLPKPLWIELKHYMPSTSLIHHEWKKHGTCYSKDPVVYFSDSLYLIQKINNSPILKFFRKNEGKIITKQALNRVINKLYPHQARKVQMKCKKGYITEIRFSLNGDINNDSFYSLLKNAKPLRGGCDKGRIAK
jgi:ribonuclease T2